MVHRFDALVGYQFIEVLITSFLPMDRCWTCRQRFQRFYVDILLQLDSHWLTVYGPVAKSICKNVRVVLLDVLQVVIADDLAGLASVWEVLLDDPE